MSAQESKYLGDGIYVTTNLAGAHHMMILTTSHHEEDMADNVIYLDSGHAEELAKTINAWINEEVV